jgi:hypothetical protein
MMGYKRNAQDRADLDHKFIGAALNELETQHVIAKDTGTEVVEDEANGGTRRLGGRSRYFIDYPYVVSLVRLHIHRIKKQIEEETETEDRYTCTNPACKSVFGRKDVDNLIQGWQLDKDRGQLVEEFVNAREVGFEKYGPKQAGPGQSGRELQLIELRQLRTSTEIALQRLMSDRPRHLRQEQFEDQLTSLDHKMGECDSKLRNIEYYGTIDTGKLFCHRCTNPAKAERYVTVQQHACPHHHRQLPPPQTASSDCLLTLLCEAGPLSTISLPHLLSAGLSWTASRWMGSRCHR